MPPLLQWARTNVAGSTKSSILTYPSTGRRAGRIDSILFSVDESGATMSGGSLPSGFELLIDDVLASGTPKFALTFQNAKDWGGISPANLGFIKAKEGGGTPTLYWAMAVFHRGLFNYRFEIKADNQDAGAHDFFVAVTGEVFSVID